MRKTPILFIVLLTAFAVAADPNATDPNEAELKDLVYQHIEQAGVTGALLKTNTYAGTIAEVFADRAADVNEVVVEIRAAKDKGRQLLILSGDLIIDPNATPADPNAPPVPKVNVGEKLLEVIAEKIKEKETLKKKQNVEILSAVDEILSDPNMPTVEEDPVAFAGFEDFRQAVLELVAANGGI